VPSTILSNLSQLWHPQRMHKALRSKNIEAKSETREMVCGFRDPTLPGSLDGLGITMVYSLSHKSNV